MQNNRTPQHRLLHRIKNRLIYQMSLNTFQPFQRGNYLMIIRIILLKVLNKIKTTIVKIKNQNCQINNLNQSIKVNPIKLCKIRKVLQLIHLINHKINNKLLTNNNMPITIFNQIIKPHNFCKINQKWQILINNLILMMKKHL